MPLLAAAAITAGAALQSATGFGFALIAAPIVFAVVGPPEAVGLLILLGFEVNLLTLFTERRRPRPLRGETAVLIAWSLPGALAGVAVLRALDPVAMQVAVSVGVIATLAARRLAAGHHVPRWAAPAAGFASGGLTTSTSTAGPPLLVYLLGRGVQPVQVRDTLTVCFVAQGLIGAAALLVTGTDAVPEAALVALLVPVAAAGHLLGRPVFARLMRGGRYEPVVTGVLLVSVAAGLAGAIV
jgi:uncharacterized membrane protein YfcA